jgi:hypothetical protein
MRFTDKPLWGLLVRNFIYGASPNSIILHQGNIPSKQSAAQLQRQDKDNKM